MQSQFCWCRCKLAITRKRQYCAITFLTVYSVHIQYSTHQQKWLTLHSVCWCMQRDWCYLLGSVSFWDTLEDGLICPCIDLLLSWPEKLISQQLSRVFFSLWEETLITVCWQPTPLKAWNTKPDTLLMMRLRWSAVHKSQCKIHKNVLCKWLLNYFHCWWPIASRLWCSDSCKLFGYMSGVF